MAALNPITTSDPAVMDAILALDPATRAEERLQSLLALWLRRYMSATAFTTLTENGGTEQRTLTACDVDFQTTSLADNPQRPVLHLILPERKQRRLDYGAKRAGHDDDWTVSLMVKVPTVLSGTAMHGLSAGQVAARVAGELEWLLCSTEREALLEKGVTRVRLEQPAVIMPPTGAWESRLLVFVCRTRREQARR